MNAGDRGRAGKPGPGPKPDPNRNPNPKPVPEPHPHVATTHTNAARLASIGMTTSVAGVAGVPPAITLSLPTTTRRVEKLARPGWPGPPGHNFVLSHHQASRGETSAAGLAGSPRP